MGTPRHPVSCLLGVLVAFISGCGGGSGGSGGSQPAPMSYTVGGTISGLQGTGLVLLDNGGANLSVAANSTMFTFGTAVANGNPYSVTVSSQPGSPIQRCKVANGSGVIAGSNVTDVGVACTTVSEELIVSDLHGSSAGFLISPADGSLSSAGVATGLTAMGQIATDPSGKFLFELNATSPGIYAYTVDAASGALVRVAGSPFAAPVALDSGLGVDPAGRFLYAGSQTGALSYAIDNTTGALSLVAGSPFAAPPNPPFPGVICGIFCVATRTFLYYPQLLGVGSFDTAGFSVNAMTGVLRSVGTLGAAACCTGSLNASIDPAGKFLLLVATRTLTSYTIDGTTGALSPGASIEPPSPGAWSDVTVDATGKFAYAIDGGPAMPGNNLYGFSADASSGALTALSPATTATGGHLWQIRFDLSGKYLYVTSVDPTAPGIWAYAVDSTTGVVTPVPGSPFATTFAPWAMVVASL